MRFVIPQSFELANSMNDLNDIKLPFVVPNVTLMSPGIWNNNYYDSNEIRKAYENTDCSNEANSLLFWDHNDRVARDLIGSVKNIRYKGDTVAGDLYIINEDAARAVLWSKMNGGLIGISPKVRGRGENGRVKDFTFENYSVVVEPAIKTAYINSQSRGENMTEIKELPQEDLVTISKKELQELVDKMIKEKIPKDEDKPEDEEDKKKDKKEMEEEPKPEPEKPEPEPEKPEPEPEKKPEPEVKKADIEGLVKDAVDKLKEKEVIAKMSQEISELKDILKAKEEKTDRTTFDTADVTKTNDVDEAFLNYLKREFK